MGRVAMVNPRGGGTRDEPNERLRRSLIVATLQKGLQRETFSNDCECSIPVT